MTGYGDSLYGSEWYLSSPYRLGGTELTLGLRARVVKPITSIPPVMDSIYVGLARRFDLLQQGIQSFALFNKIEYAKGTSTNSILPSLDDVWGKIYDLPRLTGESDDDYRARLKNYVRVLTGSGTIPATQAVLDSLIGLPGGTRITSLWPARVIIDFYSVDAMRQARSKQTLLNSVLPGMFAAGVDYELLLPYIDCYLRAAVQGDTQREVAIRAAVAIENELTCGIDALVAYGREANSYLLAAIRVEREASLPIRAAVRAERLLEPSIMAAIRGEPERSVSMYAAIQTDQDLPLSMYAAVQKEPERSVSMYAAIARNFELQCGIIARVVHMYEISAGIKAAVQATQELTIGIRARVARRL